MPLDAVIDLEIKHFSLHFNFDFGLPLFPFFDLFIFVNSNFPILIEFVQEMNAAILISYHLGWDF